MLLRGKRLAMMAWAAMMLLMASCSWGDELEETYSTVGDATTLSTTRTTTLLIPLSSGDSDDTSLTDAERQLNNLWVFVYDSGSTTSPKKIVYLSDEATEGYDYEEDSYLTIDIGGSTEIEGGTYDIYAIANAGSTFSETTATISETDLEAKTASYTSTTMPSTTEGGLMIAGHTYGKYIAAKDTTIVDLSMTYINAKVGYKFVYDISDTQHFTYTVGSTSYTSVSAAYGQVTLKVTKVEIQQVASSQMVVVGSETKSSTDDTFTYTYSEDDFPVYGNGSGKVQISDTLYLPEHYVSNTEYQTKIVITGTFTTPAGDELEQTYSFIFGGDSTNGTVEADKRTGLESLNRGYCYDVDCYVGYKVDGIFTSQVTAQNWTTGDSTDVDTDEDTAE